MTFEEWLKKTEHQRHMDWSEEDETREAWTAAFEEAKRRAVEIIEEKLITMSVEFCMGNHIEVALPDDCIKAIEELKP